MIAWIGLALAHPFGAHRAVHHLRWDTGLERTVVRYEVEVPEAYLRSGRADPFGAMQTELAAGIQLLVDGRAVPLQRTDASHGPPGHEVRFTLTFEAELPPGARRLELSDGNLMHTPPLIRTDVRLEPDTALVDSSLLVRHDGRIARSESGRVRAGDGHRRVWIEIEPDTGPLARLHRLAQGVPAGPRTDLQSLRPTALDVLTTPRTTPTAALGLLCALPWLAWRAPRTGRAGWPGVFVIVALDLAVPPGALAWPFALTALAAGLLTWRVPAARLWIAPALAASLDLRGVAALVALLQLPLTRREPAEAPHRALALVGAMLAALQLARTY